MNRIVFLVLVAVSIISCNDKESSVDYAKRVQQSNQTKSSTPTQYPGDPSGPNTRYVYARDIGGTCFNDHYSGLSIEINVGANVMSNRFNRGINWATELKHLGFTEIEWVDNGVFIRTEGL